MWFIFRYNPNVPNLAEVVRQVMNGNTSATSAQEARTTIIEAIRSTASHFKTSIPAVMGPLGLGVEVRPTP